MLTTAKVQVILPQNTFTTSVDLKVSYGHVLIEQFFLWYLGFNVDYQKFYFCCLPFSLNIAPLIFIKLTKVILKGLQLKGVQTVAYLEDWLLWGSLEELYQISTNLMLTTPQSMGFLVQLTN